MGVDRPRGDEVVILRETESKPWGPARLRGRMGQPHVAPQPESTLVFIGHLSSTFVGLCPGLSQRACRALSPRAPHPAW